MECNCCGRGTLEIKCPYSIRETGYIVDLPYMEDGHLQKNHDYFYQAQTQMLCSRLDYCDFCVWTPFELHVERIHVDEQFCFDMCEKAEVFFYEAIMPELLGRYFSNNPVER